LSKYIHCAISGSFGDYDAGAGSARATSSFAEGVAMRFSRHLKVLRLECRMGDTLPLLVEHLNFSLGLFFLNI
jgi:hypothetical protein